MIRFIIAAKADNFVLVSSENTPINDNWGESGTVVTETGSVRGLNYDAVEMYWFPDGIDRVPGLMYRFDGEVLSEIKE